MYTYSLYITLMAMQCVWVEILSLMSYFKCIGNLQSELYECKMDYKTFW
jgi:hypothetical protein